MTDHDDHRDRETDRDRDREGGDPRRAGASDDIEVYDGPGIVNASFVATGALVVVAALGAIAPAELGILSAVVSGLLFAVGVVAFLWGYATGVVRSRDEQVQLAGLFFLSGSAPQIVRFRLRIAFAVQVVAAVAAASLRPYTTVAFVVLAPMAGLGMMAAWAARHGTFPAKDPR